MFYKIETDDLDNCIREAVRTEGVLRKVFSVGKVVDKDSENNEYHTIVLYLADNKSRENLMLPLAHYVGEITKSVLREECELIVRSNEILYSEIERMTIKKTY